MRFDNSAVISTAYLKCDCTCDIIMEVVKWC